MQAQSCLQLICAQSCGLRHDLLGPDNRLSSTAAMHCIAVHCTVPDALCDALLRLSLSLSGTELAQCTGGSRTRQKAS